MSPRDLVPLEFDYLTRRRSFDALVELARTAYAGHPRDSMVRPGMWRAFPRGYVGAWLADRLLGCIQIWPLDGRRAGDFLIGARAEVELREDDLAVLCNSASTVWYFAGLLLDAAWRGRGLAAHLFAEAMVRWQRDLVWRAPIRFAAPAIGDDAMGFIRGAGFRLARPADETVDGHALHTRTFESEADLAVVVQSARDAADRKGRPLAMSPG